MTARGGGVMSAIDNARAALTENDVREDPEGAVLALRRADLKLYDAQRSVDAFENVFAAFDELRRTGYVPSGYSPQWRARAENSEGRISNAVAILDLTMEANRESRTQWTNGEVMAMLHDLREGLTIPHEQDPGGAMSDLTKRLRDLRKDASLNADEVATIDEAITLDAAYAEVVREYADFRRDRQEQMTRIRAALDAAHRGARTGNLMTPPWVAQSIDDALAAWRGETCSTESD